MILLIIISSSFLSLLFFFKYLMYIAIANSTAITKRTTTENIITLFDLFIFFPSQSSPEQFLDLELSISLLDSQLLTEKLLPISSILFIGSHPKHDL